MSEEFEIIESYTNRVRLFLNNNRACLDKFNKYIPENTTIATFDRYTEDQLITIASNIYHINYLYPLEDGLYSEEMTERENSISNVNEKISDFKSILLLIRKSDTLEDDTILNEIENFASEL